MALTAAIKFTQGPNTDAFGRALFGTLTDGAVICSSQVTGAAGALTYVWTLIDQPPGSAIALGTFSTSASGSFGTPLVRGGYLVGLTVSDGTSTVFVQLAFVIKRVSGRYLPPFLAPDSALTFGGQTRGWAVPMEDWFNYVETLAQSVFGRTGAVVAAAGDYTDAQINNTSTVPGAHVNDALTSLKTSLTALVTGVSSVYGRTGAVVAALNDYTSSLIQNSSTVTGATVTAALDALKAALPTAGPISSVFGRTGAIAAVLNDYTSSLIQNLSTVTGGGATVTTALNALQSQVTASVTGVSSAFGRTGAVVATLNDYTSSLVQNASTVTGTTVTAALDALKAALATAGPISSVFGRTGAVVAALNDYTSSLVQNSSGVAGSTVTAALNTLNAALASAGPISSVFGRTGAVVAALNDYTSSLVQNSSGVAGTTVTAALNTLNSAVAALVTGVSSVYGRTGAVVALAGDYTSTKISNASAYIPGAFVTNALDNLGPQYLSVASGTNRTLVLADLKTLYKITGTATITVPLNSSVPFPVGAEIDFLVTAAAVTVTFSGATGAVNIRTPAAISQQVQWIQYRLVYLGADEWLLTEDANARVSSVFGRTGAVVAALNDYTSSLIQNSSGVSGATVTAALNTLNASLAALVTGVSSVYGRTGAVVAALNDYTSSLIQNSSGVAGTTVTAALNTLNAAIAALVTGVSSVYGRTGAVVATAGDYTSTLVNNASTNVPGATVTAALDNLILTYLASVSSTNRTLVLSDQKKVIRVTGAATITVPLNASVAFPIGAEIDFVTTTASGITFTGATGAVNIRVSAAISNPVQWALYRLVYLGADEWLLTEEANSRVASVFGRTGAVVAALNDYTSSLVQNVSTVAGTTVTAALDTLKAALPTAGPISSVFGRTGAVVAVLNDYTSSLVQNASAVAGATVTAALNNLNTTIGGLVTGVSSVYGRSGTVVALAGDYTDAKINNTSVVSGAHVNDALTTLEGGLGSWRRLININGNYNIASTDAGCLISINGGATAAIVVDTNASVPLPIRTRIGVTVAVSGFSILVIQGNPGVTILNQRSLTPQQGRIYYLDKVDTDLWVMTEDFSSTLYGVVVPIAATIGTGWSGGVTDDYRGGGTGGAIAVPLPNYPGLTLTNILVWIEPQTGHGALPSGMPFVQLLATSTIAFPHSVASIRASQVDTSGSVFGYETQHSIALAGLAITRANTDSMWLRINDETGIAGLRLKYIAAYYG